MTAAAVRVWSVTPGLLSEGPRWHEERQELLWVDILRSQVHRGTLAAEEIRLKPFGFSRVHRTKLVNISRIAVIEPRPNGDFALRMDNGEVIAGSRRYKEAVVAIRAADRQKE